MVRVTIIALVLLLGAAFAGASSAADLVRYAVVGDAIPKPLTSSPGDTERGRRVAAGLELGNCLACHVLPIPEEQFNGTLGPDLRGIASRMSPDSFGCGSSTRGCWVPNRPCRRIIASTGSIACGPT